MASISLMPTLWQTRSARASASWPLSTGASIVSGLSCARSPREAPNRVLLTAYCQSPSWKWPVEMAKRSSDPETPLLVGGGSEASALPEVTVSGKGHHPAVTALSS